MSSEVLEAFLEFPPREVSGGASCAHPSQAAPAGRRKRDSKVGSCSKAQAGWHRLKMPADEQPFCDCKLKSNFSLSAGAI